MHNTVIIIPARMASTRLPNKPLADIHGKPMIVHVMERAMEIAACPVYVACAEEAIAEAVRQAGGQAVLTDPAHPSGTDRIYEALTQIDPEQHYQTVINVQGDLPRLESNVILHAATLLDNEAVDIATLAAVITNETERTNPNVVKAVLALNDNEQRGRALYFTRATAPYGDGPHYHHIGLYAYRRQALERFVALPPSPLELREKLEQLRALEHHMRIDAAIVRDVPLGVDTPEDLETVRALINLSSG